MFAKLLLTISLVLVVFASPIVEKRQLAQVFTRCTKPNTMALTFDDGPWVYLYDVSKALVAANATGTFFFNGNNFQCIYAADQMKRVKYAYDKGHQLAAHTWGHKDLTTLNWDQIHDEMWRVEQALQRIVGVVPAFMRPPYGKYNNLVLQASYVRKQSIVTWDFDSGDTLGASVAQRKANWDNVIGQRRSTILALSHETIGESLSTWACTENTVHEVLPYAITKLKQAGYQLVSLSTCLGKPAYQSVGAPGVPNASWRC